MAITAGQNMPGDVHHVQKERFVRMIEGLCPGCVAEMKKYGLFKITTTVRLSKAPRQGGSTTLMCFDIRILQIKLFKYSFTSLNKVDTAERNRTGLN